MKCRVFVEQSTGLVRSSIMGPDFIMEAQPVPAGCNALYVDEPRQPKPDTHFFNGKKLVALPQRQSATDVWDAKGKRWKRGGAP